MAACMTTAQAYRICLTQLQRLQNQVCAPIQYLITANCSLPPIFQIPRSSLPATRHAKPVPPEMHAALYTETEPGEQKMMSIGEALVGSVTDTKGIDSLDVVKHTLPMLGASLVAEAGGAADSLKDTVLNTLTGD